MAVGLLLSAFAKSYSKEELYLQQKFKERLADLHATVGKISFCMAVSIITLYLLCISCSTITVCHVIELVNVEHVKLVTR